MPDEFEHQVHEMLAAIRGVATSLTIGGADAFVRNVQLGTEAYSRGPDHALGLAGVMAGLRFHHLNDAITAAGERPIGYPRDDLLSRFPMRSEAVVEAVDFVDYCLSPGLKSGLGPLHALRNRHGLPGFMFLIQVFNHLGQMLVDADPDLDDLEQLASREALADESDWAAWLAEEPGVS